MAQTEDREFYENLLNTLVAPLVGNPDEIKVDYNRRENGVSLLLTVDGDDTGRVIGKGGSSISAIRTILEFAGERRNDRVVVDLKDD